MNGYSVEIIKDSVNVCGNRLTTFALTYPRFVHAELMTHREFSRGASSSRAIPTSRLVKKITEVPAMPLWWGKNKRGMQADEEIENIEEAKKIWLDVRDYCIQAAEKLSALGLHKQATNRIIEPWMFITVIVSATNYANWIHLRDTWPEGKPPGPAQPELSWVAREMRKALEISVPNLLKPGEWHLPYVETANQLDKFYVSEEEISQIEDNIITGLKKTSTARCARVSYLSHNGTRDLGLDISLHDHLRSSGHWTPFEHVAEAMSYPVRIGNFIGWKQYRKEFPDEHVTEYKDQSIK